MNKWMDSSVNWRKKVLISIYLLDISSLVQHTSTVLRTFRQSLAGHFFFIVYYKKLNIVLCVKQ